MSTAIINKDVSVMETDRYVIVKIPRPSAPQKEEQVSIDEFIGILKDVPAFKGKTSVQVQHMIKDLWSERYLKHKTSS
jgi:hypothetical protein